MDDLQPLYGGFTKYNAQDTEKVFYWKDLSLFPPSFSTEHGREIKPRWQIYRQWGMTRAVSQWIIA